MSVLMFWLHTRNIRVYSCCICSKKNNNTLCITHRDKYKYTNLLSQHTFLIICQLQRWPSLPPCHLLFLVSNNLWTWFRIETIIVTMLSLYPCLVTRVTLSLIVAQASVIHSHFVIQAITLRIAPWAILSTSVIRIAHPNYYVFFCIVCSWCGHWVNTGDLFHYNNSKEKDNVVFLSYFDIFFKGTGR